MRHSLNRRGARPTVGMSTHNHRFKRTNTAFKCNSIFGFFFPFF